MRALAFKSRDNARTPMQWDAGEHAGFSHVEPWLPVNPNHTTLNVVAQEADPHSVLSHYRALIALRHDHPLVVDGRFELLLPDHDQLWVISRGEADHRLLVVANVSSRPSRVEAGWLPDLSAARVLLSTHPDRDAMVGDDAQLLLAWESRVLELRLPAR